MRQLRRSPIEVSALATVNPLATRPVGGAFLNSSGVVEGTLNRTK